VKWPRPGSPAGIAFHLFWLGVAVYCYGLMFGAWRLP
jgi:hypothetical protein